MANLRGKQTFTETVAAPISPATVIQCTSEIMFQSTDWTASSATHETQQHVYGGAHLLDTIDVKALLPADRARGVLVHVESSTYETSSASESPALSSLVSETVDIDTSLSSFCSSQKPVANLKSILKTRIEPRSPQSFNTIEFDSEDNIEYDADSDMDEDDGKEDDETGTNDSDWSDEYDDNEYSDEEGSFVCFVNSVRFSAKDDICIIPSIDETGDDRAEPEMTFHEQAHRMQGSKRVPFEPYTVNRKDYDPNEHSPDVIDLDKQLFMAYVNGIRNMNAEDYQPIVLSRTLNAAPCDVDVLPVTEHQVNAYLDRVVDSLLGFFPYLFGKDEYNRLLDVAEVVTSFDDYNNVLYKPDSGLFQQAITRQLERKLADTLVIIENNILDWVAGELVEPLGRHASFRWG
ncbi:hypothetical protein EMCG_02760 [[Emmonsia] crescens]|uniref:Uncharacterized protein n=1 Tax=[Emmonsia] crescens TaxID=73230 RepID=A0A0G2J153_9EURO|nr:hypothetical protein EMCG_02760 [Emmonsia crescens UAMH 3008]